MNWVLLLVLSLTAIECNNQKICDVFAPKGVFSGGVKIHRFYTKNGIQLKMYRIGENGFEWDIELRQIGENKSIEFVGEGKACCERYSNRYSFKYINANEVTYNDCNIETVISQNYNQ